MNDDIRSSNLTNKLLIDVICDRFEEACRSNQKPQLESYLGELSEPTRGELFQQLFRIERDCDPNQCESPASRESASRFPGKDDVVETLFEADGERCETEATRELESGQDVFARPQPESRGDRYQGQAYQVLRTHAEGGLGIVSIALDRRLNREVAVKHIRDKFRGDMESRLRFLNEAEITGALDHPGIIPVYNVDQTENGNPFYVMPLVRGETLRSAITTFHAAHTNKGFSKLSTDAGFRKLLRRFLDVCDTISFAHDRGVIHRDIKPQNVMLGPYGETLVVDWGLAKFIDVKSNKNNRQAAAEETTGFSFQTQAGQIVGTPSYMAPEQALGQTPLTIACDIYALGATFYCMLTGQAPRLGNNAQAIKQAQLGTFEPAAKIVPRLPKVLDAICNKAMSIDPLARYRTASDLRFDLERWLDDEPVSCYRNRIAETAGRWIRKNRNWAGIAALSLGVVTAVSLTSTMTVEQARRTESSARQRADRNLSTSLTAIEKMLVNVGSRQLAGIPQMTQVRQSLLDEGSELMTAIQRESPDDFRILKRLARVQIQMAHMALFSGDFERANEMLDQADQLIQQAKSLDPDDKDLSESVNVQLVRGQLHQELGEWKQSEFHFKEALEMKGQWPLVDGDLIPLELAPAVGDLADVMAQQGKMHDADRMFWLSKARFELDRSQLDSDQTHEFVRILASYGQMNTRNGEFVDARENLKRAREACESILKADSVNPESRQLMARICTALAELDWYQAGRAVAEETCRRGLVERKRLVQEFPQIPRYRLELAASQANLAFYCFQRDRGINGSQYDEYLLSRKNEIEVLYQEAILSLQNLIQEHPNVASYLDSLANAETNFGNFYSTLGDNEKSLKEYQNAINALRTIVTDVGESPKRISALGGALNNLAVVMAGNGDYDLAIENYLQAIECQQKAIQSGPKSPVFRSYLRNHLDGLSKVYSLKDSGKLALQTAQECLECARDLYRDQGDVGDHRAQLNMQCNALAYMLSNFGDEGDPAALERACDLVDECIERSPRWRSYYVHLAALKIRMGDRSSAEQALDHAEDLESDPQELADQLLVDSSLQLLQGEPERAQETLGQAELLIDRMSTEGSLFHRFYVQRLIHERDHIKKRFEALEDSNDSPCQEFPDQS